MIKKMSNHKNILLVILGLLLVVAVSGTYASSKMNVDSHEGLVDCPYNHDTSICPYDGDHDICPFQNAEVETVEPSVIEDNPLVETNTHEGCPNAASHGFLD